MAIIQNYLKFQGHTLLCIEEGFKSSGPPQ